MLSAVLPGISCFWQHAEMVPSTGWNNRIEKFELAALARHSISLSEILKTPTDEDPRIPALLRISLVEIVETLLYLSTVKTGRKVMMEI